MDANILIYILVNIQFLHLKLWRDPLKMWFLNICNKQLYNYVGKNGVAHMPQNVNINIYINKIMLYFNG